MHYSNPYALISRHATALVSEFFVRMIIFLTPILMYGSGTVIGINVDFETLCVNCSLQNVVLLSDNNSTSPVQIISGTASPKSSRRRIFLSELNSPLSSIGPASAVPVLAFHDEQSSPSTASPALFPFLLASAASKRINFSGLCFLRSSISRFFVIATGIHVQSTLVILATTVRSSFSFVDLVMKPDLFNVVSEETLQELGLTESSSPELFSV